MTPIIHNFSWQDISILCQNISRKIEADNFQPDIIVTPQRGGFVPTAILSHLLRCREVIVVDIKRTLSDEIHAAKTPPTLTSDIDTERLKDKKILVIDDIIGSGETLHFLLNILGKCKPKAIKTSILVQNDENFEKSLLRNNLKPDYLGKNVRGWVIFPWEK